MFIIQYTDLHHNFAQKNLFFGREVRYESPLKSKFWTDASGLVKNIVFIPSYFTDYDHFSWYATNHGLTLNTGYFARGPYQDIERYTNEKAEQLLAGHANSDDLYIIKTGELIEIFTKCDDRISCVFVDGYIAAFSNQTKLDIHDYSDVLKFTGVSVEFVDYLNYLSENYGNKDYLILASVRDESTSSINEEISDKMRQSGMSGELMGKYRWSYAWVKASKNNEILLESLNEAMIDHTLPSGLNIAGQPLRSDIIIKSAGHDSGNLSEIIINGINYSLAFRGMNFVVYDVINDRVVELASFDLHSRTDGITARLPK